MTGGGCKLFKSIRTFRVTKTIADSSRIQTMKFFERENIKQMLLKERDLVTFKTPVYNAFRNSKRCGHSERNPKITLKRVPSTRTSAFSQIRFHKARLLSDNLQTKTVLPLC